ncbi:hypothetical protein HNQ85_001299 [Anoxybacillus calidus]|uniref:Uncharacterized protein n=1 Tax=[Anoxybacillus] calidus TaxID=575178 RepID=A0A7W0BWG5_9BACL|nr:hypothetical protein [Anoxybacillus calidus]MBA2871029.1 hypothetical protein [Anoxybacillus calidus]
MPIQWFSPNTPIPTLTIASYGISFNSGSTYYLKDVKKIMLGCDTEKKKLYIKLLKGDNEPGFSVPTINENTKSVRISCREFVQYLDVKCKIDTSKASKYFIDIVGNEMIVDLNTPIPIEKSIKK